MNLEFQLETIEKAGYRGSKLAFMTKLARLCNGKNGVITSQQSLADACNLTTRSIQYITATLKADGVLNVVYQAGANLENLYELRYEALTERSKQTR